jgi:hypothetical protein
MVQGYDPNNPNPWNNQQPQGGANGAFGFDSAPKQEKYNTQYLASNMQKSRRTGQLIVLGILVAVGGFVAWFAATSDSGHKPPAAAAVPGMPGAPEAPPAAAEGAAAEAKPAGDAKAEK